jgi:hypothetical protein
MLDPLTLLAARNGTVDAHPVPDLVAAGHALLQRCAPLVRALHGRQLAVLLPPSHRIITAIAASEGRSAIFIDPALGQDQLHDLLRGENVGACLTLAQLANRLPPALLRVELDRSPRTSTVVGPDVDRVIDLTTHTGLMLEGEAEVPGAMSEAVRCASAEDGVETLSHRTLLETGRALARSLSLTAADRFLTVAPVHSRFGLMHGMMTPLVAGLALECADAEDPVAVGTRLMDGGITVFVSTPEACAAILATGTLRVGSALRAAVCGPRSPDDALRRAWAGATGVPLWQGS